MTSSLPDGDEIISSVKLKVKRESTTGSGNPLSVLQGFKVDVKKGYLSSSTALEAADFQAAAYTVPGAFSPSPSSGWYSINLKAARNKVNRAATNGGVTQIRLRFKLDDSDDSLDNYLSLFSGDAGSNKRPQLIVAYYDPTP
jgi:hypothetical protein